MCIKELCCHVPLTSFSNYYNLIFMIVLLGTGPNESILRFPITLDFHCVNYWVFSIS
uniref:Uncharacterized protein n=1 Tax=Macaca fascicularis TaxID=9541 RepID=A0A7N9C9U6_MACFA